VYTTLTIIRINIDNNMNVWQKPCTELESEPRMVYSVPIQVMQFNAFSESKGCGYGLGNQN